MSWNDEVINQKCKHVIKSQNEIGVGSTLYYTCQLLSDVLTEQKGSKVL